MVKLLLGLAEPPTPHDVADALAIALCHLQSSIGAIPDEMRENDSVCGRAPSSRNRRCGRGATTDRDRVTQRFLIEKHPSRVVIDVGGVGYDVQVPLSTFYGLGEPGATVVLRIHTHVREDLIALYGFSTPLEQDLFERLIAISGIGPKLGLAVLSGIEPADLIRAIRTQDVARLTRYPASAKDRRADRARAERPAAAGRDSGRRTGAGHRAAGDQLRDDLLSALVNLGYQSAAAEKAIDRRHQGVTGRGLRAGAARRAQIDDERAMTDNRLVTPAAGGGRRAVRGGAAARARSTTTSARIA